MKYTYECVSCGATVSIARTFDERNDPLVCEACEKGFMWRIYTAPQLITQPTLLKDENKFALGFSETERTETRKRDDKAYAKNWNISEKEL